MCGRARCTLRPNEFPGAFHRSHGPVRTINMDRYRPSYNAAPGFNLPVARRGDASDGDGYVLHCMKWGLIPSFTKKNEKPDFYKMFNARSESLSEKASFRRLLPKNRCLVAVEGFYEWKKDGSKKQPYYIHLKDGRPLVFAALYDSWESSEGEILYTFTIVTTSSSSALEWLHDRMPVILGDKESTDIWLSGSSSSKFTILKPYENADLAWYPVTPAMGKTSFDGPECIKEIQLKTEERNPLLKFFSRKEREKEQESNLEVKTSSAGLMKRKLPESLEEEPKQNLEKEQESALEEKHSFEEVRTNQPKSVEEELSKGIKEEQDSNLKEKDLGEETRKNVPKSVKEEPAVSDLEGTESLTGEEDRNTESTLSTQHKEDKPRCLGKRDHGALSKQALDSDAAEKSKNTAKRKGNLKGDSDKQPTLFSYFGRK